MKKWKNNLDFKFSRSGRQENLGMINNMIYVFRNISVIKKDILSYQDYFQMSLMFISFLSLFF